ncbi:MAG: hypothetical protein L3J11_04245 [Draconibacterium sp.]|nr:hypothetical protein [Draconibacterium sp.]
MVKFKKKISKKLLLRLALFVAVIGVASMFDVYFENNPEKLVDIQDDSADNNGDQGKIYFVGQSNSVDFKTFDQKNFGRKLQVKSHDKFIQKNYQQRNYQILKAEVQKQTTPLILSYHYLVFKNYFFTDPDDDPLIS